MGLPYLGCFKDSGSRDLNNLGNDMSPKDCFKKARDNKYEFAAMQNGKQCFGGNTVGKHGDAP
jgi:hypothetical protein